MWQICENVIYNFSKSFTYLTSNFQTIFQYLVLYIKFIYLIRLKKINIKSNVKMVSYSDSFIFETFSSRFVTISSKTVQNIWWAGWTVLDVSVTNGDGNVSKMKQFKTLSRKKIKRNASNNNFTVIQYTFQKYMVEYLYFTKLL